MSEELSEPWTIPRFKEVFDQAVCLRNEGHPELGVPLIDQILEEYPQDRIANMFKGSLLYLAEQFPAACDCFNAVLRQDPYHERASLALFLSLALNDQFVDAVKEMERFLGGNDSRRYLQVCRDYPERFSQVFEELDLDDFPLVRSYLNWDAMATLPPTKDWLDHEADTFLPEAAHRNWGSAGPDTKA